MEKKFIIRDINSKPITALLYHALRREIITGYEGSFVSLLKCINVHIQKIRAQYVYIITVRASEGNVL